MKSLLAALTVTLAQLHATPPPDIVYILSDDMGFSDIGCYGSEISTPNLDTLAAGGIRFTQFYNTGRCCPTRASLLTGLYPHQAGIGHMTGDYGLPGYQGDLNRNSITIAEALKPAGYRSYASGKWHVTKKVSANTEADKHNWPLQRGFDRYYGTIIGANSFWDPAHLTRDNTTITAFNDPEYPAEDYYYTDAISDNAARFIREHDKSTPEKPLFLYVAYTAAHWPMHARERDIAKYKGKYDSGYAAVRNERYRRMSELALIDPKTTSPRPIPDKAIMTGESWEWDKRNMEVYAAMIDSMDQGIGRIVAALKETGRFENTLICFLQDNGGCAEGFGRGGKDGPRADKPTLPRLGKDFLQTGITPKQTRDGYPVRQGHQAMAGPDDTYVAYGEAWATVSNTPFRLYKHYVHEGGISTPMIAHWPKGINVNYHGNRTGKFTRRPSSGGPLCHEPGHLIDLMATAVDLAQVEYPATAHGGREITPLEGRSLRKLFLGGSLDREALYWEHEGNRAIRKGEWKLVSKFNSPWELYNIANDRSEQNDLAEAQPERARKLEQMWQAYADRSLVAPWQSWKKEKGAAGANRSQRKFDLTTNSDLSRNKAPYLVNRGFRVSAAISKTGNGVIVAQGGSTSGWALYLDEQRPVFVLTNRGERRFVRSEKALASPIVLAAELSKDRTITLTAGQEVLISSKLPALLMTHPLDGLTVGHDSNGSVGGYPIPSAFTGKIDSVQLMIEAKN